jgi:hypothetical protein
MGRVTFMNVISKVSISIVVVAFIVLAPGICTRKLFTAVIYGFL